MQVYRQPYVSTFGRGRDGALVLLVGVVAINVNYNNRVQSMKRTLLSLMATALMSATALAADVKPGLLFDMGGKFDKSFNEAAYNGAVRFKDETGIEFREFEISNDAQREQALRRFARDGNNPIVMAGFLWAGALEKVAKDYPDINFAIIDMGVDVPNVRSVVFKEQEGSYLVGVMAGLASKSNTVSFVGGMDIPLIRAFACGYAGGVKSVNPDANIIETMTGTTPEAWNNQTKGAEITKSQIDQGSDVVFQAAGGTGIAVLQTAADAGILGIGVDSNQNHMHPGSVLTSMLKRVDVAVYNAFMDGKNESFSYGVQALGLQEEGVGYAMDENNASLVSEEMTAAVEAAKADILSGKVAVHDYRSDNNCPY